MEEVLGFFIVGDLEVGAVPLEIPAGAPSGGIWRAMQDK
jgi:hypothetical protein